MKLGGDIMKRALCSLLITVAIFFFNVWFIVPLISNVGYSSVESSYHLVTHSLLLSLIFVVVFCTVLILEKVNGNTKNPYGKRNI